LVWYRGEKTVDVILEKAVIAYNGPLTVNIKEKKQMRWHYPLLDEQVLTTKRRKSVDEEVAFRGLTWK